MTSNPYAMQLLPIEESGTTQAPIEHAGADVVEVVKATVALYARRGYVPPWTGYLAVDDGLCMGGCGFAGPPKDGEVEIAYFTFPGNEGRGVATRMARELLRITRQAAERARVRFIAHTLPQVGASTTILRKIGFTLQGEIVHPEDGQVWKWLERLPREA